MSRRTYLGLAAAGVVAVSVLATAAPASAHPLGNFSVNQYAELTVRPAAVDVHLVLDLAEIPTFQARADLDRDNDGAVSETERQQYADSTCREAAEDLDVVAAGDRLPLVVSGASAVLTPGSADLPVLRISCRSTGALAREGFGAGDTTVTFRSRAYEGRAGWREVVAMGDGMRLVRSNVPATSISRELTAYPEDQLSAPLDVDSARLVVTTGGPGAVTSGDNPISRALPRQLDGATARLTSVVSGDLTLVLGASAVALALFLGALHAFAPGHGKTVIAAYLVAERGSLRQASLIGLCVTVTHTAGVLALGIVLSTWSAFAPDRLYPVLGIVSGLLLTWIGVVLVRRALARRRSTGHHHHDETSHGHAHGDTHGHTHHHDEAGSDDMHQHGGTWHRHPEIKADTAIGWRSLVLMGAAGGLVPSPSALVVLLAATALGRAWFGALLVVAYGAGMALTLIAAGVFLTRARRLFDRRRQSKPGLTWLAPLLPVVTSSVIVIVGISLAARSVLTL